MNKFGKVLIVGGGLGGLALAQFLQNAGVPFEIFERDAAPRSRNQGWAIALLESISALRELLPPDVAENIHRNSVNFNTGDNDDFAFVNAHTAERVALLGGVKFGQPGSFLRASREELRAFLWTAKDLPVSAGKKFTGYTTTDEGVIASFEDGSSASGTLLVGADGVHSQVLGQLVGTDQHRPKQSPNVPFFGEVDLPPEEYEPLRDLARSTVLASWKNLRLQIGMLHMSEDRSSARFFWTFVIRCDRPEALSGWVQTAGRQAVFDYVMESSKEIHPSLKRLIEYGGPDALVEPQPKFMEFVPPDDLPISRVTVLGDAAHAMPPFRGAGANTAILDAYDIAKLLITAHKDGADALSVVAPYHAAMIPRGREMVLSSIAAGGPDSDDAAMHFANFQRKQKA